MLSYVLLLHLFSLLSNLVNCEICSGDWGTWTSSAPPVSSFVMSSSRVRNYNEDEERNKEWLQNACSVQVVQFSCYYRAMDNDTIVSSIENRHWKSNDPDCRPFWPLDVLESFRNKKILFLGDSLVAQMYMSLVCSLTQSTTTKTNIQWKTNSNSKFCPFHERHCHIIEAVINFPRFNATLISDGMHLHIYDKHVFASRLLFHNFFSADNIIVANIGAWYNTKEEYTAALNDMLQDIGHYKKMNSNFPKILFVQTLPQHFPEDDGFYVVGHDQKYNMIKSCKNRENLTLAKSQDWRNNIAELLIRNSYNDSAVEILYVANALYSEADSHIGTYNFKYIGLDCTHWCFPSGVFNYLIRVLYNTLIFHNYTSLPVVYRNQEN